MQKIKTQKGITLIALIITIIVMLILVAVTLVITLGDNGIIAKARTANEKQALRQEAENSTFSSQEAEGKIDSVVAGTEPWEINTGDEQVEEDYYVAMRGSLDGTEKDYYILKVLSGNSEPIYRIWYAWFVEESLESFYYCDGSIDDLKGEILEIELDNIYLMTSSSYASLKGFESPLGVLSLAPDGKFFWDRRRNGEEWLYPRIEF